MLQALPGDATYNSRLGKGIDILMGGGRQFFVPTGVSDEEGGGGSRSDKRDLRQEFQKVGYTYVWNRAGFDVDSRLPSTPRARLRSAFTRSGGTTRSCCRWGSCRRPAVKCAAYPSRGSGLALIPRCLCFRRSAFRRTGAWTCRIWLEER